MFRDAKKGQNTKKIPFDILEQKNNEKTYDGFVVFCLFVSFVGAQTTLAPELYSKLQRQSARGEDSTKHFELRNHKLRGGVLQMKSMTRMRRKKYTCKAKCQGKKIKTNGIKNHCHFNVFCVLLLFYAYFLGRFPYCSCEQAELAWEL